MKKYIVIAFILSPIIAFGATALIKEYKPWDFMASIQTSNGGNVFIYKIDDPKDEKTKCYVFVNDKTNYNGISCVK